ncbi:NAD-dependent histone deacetylase HST3 [Cytospora mali]|uniref:NAD-dependent histone deacetylase HST3 n=1 Tax=Cytospora mali TaxID=578113 RepID=A0A194VVB0_CYTMA|nr:NAD-dependent histone deacetylase HST3 [Valsa mali]
MPTVHVQAGSSADLQEIANSLFKAKKVVVITGAGISTNSGIPDFRSENGLYSMIQGQFDAAAKLDGLKSDDARNAGDDRPRKRRRVSPSPVGDTIEVKDATEGSKMPIEGESIEVLDQNESSISNGDDCIEAVNQEAYVEKPCPQAEGVSRIGLDPMDMSLGSDPRDEEVVLLSEESVLAEEWNGDPDSGLPTTLKEEEAQAKSDGARQPSSVVFAKKKGPEQDTQFGSPVPAKAPPTSLTTSPPTAQAQSSVNEHNSTASQHQQHPSFSISKPRTLPSDHNLRVVSSSGPSTPKQSSSDSGAQTTTLSSPLSSPPPIMSDPYEEPLTNSRSSSSRCTSPDSSDDVSPSSNRPFNSQVLKHASLSTLKGRDLFDASIWSDPLKTSVFYTFATNLRQKSRYASPSGSHHFISHLRNTGKMVRCYTQNIDLLEDKVGLATHLLLGTGSRSRFSTRNAKAAAAASSRQDLYNSDSQITEFGPNGRPTVPGGNPKPVLAADTGSTRAPTSSNQQTSSGLVEEVNVVHRETRDGDQGMAEGTSQEGGDRRQLCADNGKKPSAANSNNLPQNLEGGGASQSGPSSPEPDRGVECVYLHGSLRALRCFQCGGVVDWDEGDRELQTMSGQQPPCPRCEDATAARQERGKRALGVGKLRPDIVLYGEEHPESQQISDIIQHDLSLAPDMLIIMGTSLKVHGLKTVVKEFAKAVHNKKEGKVIFINYTKPADSVWADTIDFWVQMDCDAWVHDLKEKKPLIWLPPGSVVDEPRNNKKRRRANVETEKIASKELLKQESSVGTTTMAPSSKSNKVQKRETLKQTRPHEPKPQPKRPAAFRDHKANGAFLTTKIIKDLAAISGRNIPKYSTVTTAETEAPRVDTPVSTSEEPVVTKQSLRKGRGPRLKNARTRNPGSKVTTSTETIAVSDPIVEPTKPAADQIEYGKSHTKNNVIQVGASRSSATSTHARLPSLVKETISKSAARDVDGAASLKQPVLAVMPIRNNGPGPAGEGNSILAAVKSHHRIRKPKAFFEPKPVPPSKSVRGTPVPSGSNAKPRAKPAPQGKKPKLLGKTAKVEQGRQAPHKQTPILPPPRPRPRKSTSTSTIRNTTAPQQPGAPVESYTLPPLHPQNLESYRYPTQCGDWPCPPAQPPAYLEPIVVVDGPPSDMSPTTSPQHWRNHAFSLRDPQSRHLEGPCRGLDFITVPSTAPPAGPPDVMGVSPTLAPPPAQLTAQMIKINAAPPSAFLGNAPFLAPPHAAMMDAQPPPGVQSIEDSPNRQLQRENEAAAALSQLRSPPIFDDRRFAMI